MSREPDTARTRRLRGRPARELLEETITVLRRTPSRTLCLFYLGAIPFWLGLLFFLGDMSRSAFAGQDILGASLVLALLYLWKKCWQAVAAGQWRSLLLLERRPPWSLARVFRLVAGQAVLQPWGLLLRPLAMAILLPTVWVAAFYQSACVMGDWPAQGESLWTRAREQAGRWPGQAHAAYGILSLFTFYVWLNVVFVLGASPQLWRIFTGIETMASMSPQAWILNGTFLVVTVALTALCVEPIWKVMFVLRCFQGEVLHSGADLRVKLRERRALAAAALAATVLLLAPPAPARAAPPARLPAVAAAPERLDRELGTVLERREYAWRLPRPKTAPSDSFFDKLNRWLRESMASLSKKWHDLKKALFPTRDSAEEEGSASGLSLSPGLLRATFWGLVVVLIMALVYAAWRTWGAPRAVLPKVTSAPPAPDLQAEDLLATQLPEEGWLRLVREMMERGEYRLALRAAYLGGLAHLGDRGLLAIARHKSNRDYGRELRRRARTREALLAAFHENLQVFEGAWYGRALVSAEQVHRFTANLERMRAC